MNNSGALGSHASRFPVEVCENIIDMLYSSTLLRDQIEHTRALRSCALVCRAWRTRSQRNLFYFVILHGTEAIRRLAVVLDNGPHLCHYVREVILVGRTLHSTTNTLPLPRRSPREASKTFRLHCSPRFGGRGLVSKDVRVAPDQAPRAPPSSSSLPALPLCIHNCNSPLHL